MKSVCSRRSDASTASMMWRRLLPASHGFGSHRPEALRRDDELVAAALQPAAEDLLGAAGGGEVAAERVHVGRVEEGDALLVGVIEDRARAVLVDLEAEGHGAEADAGDLEAGAAETNVLHGAVLSLSIDCLVSVSNERLLGRSGTRAGTWRGPAADSNCARCALTATVAAAHLVGWHAEERGAARRRRRRLAAPRR